MAEARFRIRVTYAKTGSLRFTGHLDMQRVWERTLRRSTLPVSFSQGFHPQVRLQLATSLPVGLTSSCELMDFWLENPTSPSDICAILCTVVPPGIGIQKVESVNLQEPPLQIRVVSAEYLAILDPTYLPAAIMDRVSELLASIALIRTRREKLYDLRPLIESLVIENPGESPVHLRMRLSARESGNGRPEEVLAALGIKFEESRVERIALHLKELSA